MSSVIIPIILGIVVIVIGVLNMMGNISSLHWYHRRRVTEENRIPFGRMVGLGTVIIGASIVVFSILSLIGNLMKIHLFSLVGSIIMIVGIVIGLALNFYAMIKYNRGIF